MTAATTLGVFDALAEGQASPRRLAESLGLDPLGMETLAAALIALGYLAPSGSDLRNTPVAERLLVRSSPESIATFVTLLECPETFCPRNRGMTGRS